MSKFIVFEGIEGSGKTSVAFQVKKFLINYLGIKSVVSTHEPGGTPISEILNSLIKIGSDGISSSILDYTELLLFYAARVQLLENVIKPALSKGIYVVGDRCDFSSYAYQGGGRGISRLLIKYLSRVVLDGFRPDIIFYLDVPPEIGLSRIKHRGGQLDNIEKESLDFFNRVRECYRMLASKNNYVVTIDATQNFNKVNDDVFQYLQKWLFNT